MLMEMDFFKGSARCSRLEKNRNNVIREKMNITNSVLDYIRYKQLNWYGHVQRMDQERLPRRILEWCPPGRRRKEDLGIPGYMRLQQELATWNGSTERGRERKLFYHRHRKM